MTPLRRLAACWCAVLLVAALTGCDAAAPATPVAAHVSRGYRVVDSPADGSLRMVPDRPNGALAVFVHGWGQSRESLVRVPTKALVAARLARAGYEVLSADAELKAWGDAASVDDYARLIRRTARSTGARDVFLMGESMGGLATMQLAARLPDVRAVVAWYPVCDLRTMLEARFQPTIDAAWKDAARTAVSPVAVGATPLLVWASLEDTVVDARRNAAVCVRAARAAGATATWFRTTGQHGDRSNFDPAAVLATVPGNDVGTIGLPIVLLAVLALVAAAVVFFVRRRR